VVFVSTAVPATPVAVLNEPATVTRPDTWLSANVLGEIEVIVGSGLTVIAAARAFEVPLSA
jgi:hypothetical protein